MFLLLLIQILAFITHLCDNVGDKVGDKMFSVKAIVNDLLQYTSEREWFEFKENWYEPYEIGQYISALSNSAVFEGRRYAYLVWGISDKTQEIVGTDFDYNSSVKNEPLKHYLSRQLSPFIDFSFDEGMIQGKRVVLLRIPATKTVPLSFDNERYIRIGSSKEKLRRYPEKESNLFYYLRSGHPTIENTPSAYQDLTFEKLFIYYGAKGLKLNQDTFKKNLSLLTEDGKYNVLAQLLSDNSQLPLRVAIFSGKSKTSELFSVKEFGYQCILYTLEDVLRYGDILNIIQADERGRVVERKDVPLFEYEAFREAIINAFVHNKWVSGNEPMIAVYSDRMEILSRGTIDPEQTMEGFFAGESVPVNKKLSEIVLQFHNSEKTGRGVPKIIDTYGRTAFEFRENSIVVTIPFRWINMPGDKVSDKKTKQALPTGDRIFYAIKNNPDITIPEIATLLGVGKTTVDNGISVLKRNGKIERVGSNKTGYWKIIKQPSGNQKYEKNESLQSASLVSEKEGSYKK